MTADPRVGISAITEIRGRPDTTDLTGFLKLAMWCAFASGVTGTGPAERPRHGDSKANRQSNPFHDMIH